MLAIVSYKLKPIQGAQKMNNDGTFDVLVGQVGTENTSGTLYDSSTEVRRLFDGGSRFKTKTLEGQIFGEAGHPERGDMGDAQFRQRLLTISPAFTAFHIHSVKITSAGEGDMYNIFLRIKPAGIYGEALKQSLLDDNQNTAFSLRGFSKTIMGVRKLLYVVTFDWVCSPGIREATKSALAEKYSVPSMESDNYALLSDVIHTEFSESEIQEMITTKGFTMEADENSCVGDLCQLVGKHLEARKPFKW